MLKAKLSKRPGSRETRREARSAGIKTTRKSTPVPLAQTVDTNYESLRALIEAPVPRRSPVSEVEGANQELSLFG